MWPSPSMMRIMRGLYGGTIRPMTEGTPLLRALRAVRRFSDQPVSDEALREILETVRWTGSAKNVQPWHLIVVRDRETLRKLSECGDFAQHLAGAKLAIVLVMNGRGNSFDAGRL